MALLTRSIMENWCVSVDILRVTNLVGDEALVHLVIYRKTV